MFMSSNRRDFFTKLSAISASVFASRKLLPAQQKTPQPGMGQMDHMQHQNMQRPSPPPEPTTNVRVTPGATANSSPPKSVPVTTPDIPDLPFTMDNGVKVFNLIAEPVKQVIVPGRTFDLWGFNGSAPGPTIQANEGDRVRFLFDNRLPEPTGKLAEQASQRAEASLIQARKAVIPDVQVTGILAQNNSPLIENNPARATGLQGGAQIGVQLPIFNRNQGNVAAARGEIERTKQDLARLKLQIERDLATLFRDYDSARLTVQQYNSEMLPRAEQAYKLYQLSYQKMAAAYPQVLISQRTWFQLQADYIQALENAWQTSLTIRGFGLMDGLSEPVNPSMAGSQSANPGTGGSSSRATSVQ